MIEFRDDFTDSGTPSHFEFTLGTFAGSFCGEIPWRPTGLTVPPFAAACFRWDSANCSKASCEGSFNVRKPRTPFFFFFDDAFDSRDVEPLEEARLVDAPDDVLLESDDGRVGISVVDAVVGLEFCWSARVSLEQEYVEVVSVSWVV